MIKLLICDLDNTLYDWVGFFVPAFDAMVDELADATGVSEEKLLDSFRRVHQRHGTSEYALAVAELDVLAEVDASLDVRERLEKHSAALSAFRECRRRGLHLYPDVRRTLEALRDAEMAIVAHTDAMGIYARTRLRQLGIEHLFDGVWALSDHELPVELHHDEVRRLLEVEPESSRQLVGRDVSAAESKPNPAVVFEILRSFGAAPGEALYIGDSLTKDVLVAQRAGVVDVYAAYGRAHERAQYQRLVDITHWTEADVRRERELREHDVQPTHVVERFSDILHIVADLDPNALAGRRSTTRVG
ncbi:MAG TPA: HAD family hydrolase [Solirubrobacteraceae bacterium]|nr:HAD family hydrolase [Solirubrobacteraceae bacterium]